MPSISSGTGICFILATLLRWVWLVGMKERAQVGVYLMNARANGTLLSLEYPIAWGVPESGTPPM